MTALKSKTSIHSFMNGSCLGCGRKRSVLKNEVAGEVEGLPLERSGTEITHEGV